MKLKTVTVILFAVLLLAGCSKKGQPVQSSGKTDSKKITVSENGKALFVEVQETVTASELQKYLENNNFSSDSFDEMTLSLNSYGIEKDQSFTVDVSVPYLLKVKEFINQDFNLVLNDFTFENTATLSLNYLSVKTDEELNSLIKLFPNVTELYVNDRFSELKLQQLDFLTKLNKLEIYEIYTDQSDNAIYNKMISDYAENIYSGRLNHFGLVKIYGTLGFPLAFSDSDAPYDLVDINPSWYTGKDISGVPAWVKSNTVQIYEEPHVFSKKLKALKKNDSVLIKAYYNEDVEVPLSIITGMYYSDEQDFEDSMADEQVWFLIKTHDNVQGYVRGDFLRLKY